jgi:isopentenyl phosphate kinase
VTDRSSTPNDRGSPVVLKLGGSLITAKDRPETVDEEALAAAGEAIAAADVGGAPDRGDAKTNRAAGLVLVHGGGSFGHHHASEHGLSTTDGSRDVAAVTDVHGAMGVLSDAVLAALRERGVPAVPVHPLSLAARESGANGSLTLPLASVRTLLAEGFVPVVHGDLVATAGAGVTVVSGDELVVELAAGLGADRVGVCSTVPGVLDVDGDVIPTIDAFGPVAEAVGASDATDVSGGMAAKVRELLALDAPASVFGPADLGAFLRGASPGTTIE